MVKAIVLTLAFILICLAAYLITPNQDSKKAELNSAMGTLGNIAETQAKTDDNMKTFNDIFHENDKKKNQP
jgi:hypothetical protein